MALVIATQLLLCNPSLIVILILVLLPTTNAAPVIGTSSTNLPTTASEISTPFLSDIVTSTRDPDSYYKSSRPNEKLLSAWSGSIIVEDNAMRYYATMTKDGFVQSEREFHPEHLRQAKTRLKAPVVDVLSITDASYDDKHVGTHLLSLRRFGRRSDSAFSDKILTVNNSRNGTTSGVKFNDTRQFRDSFAGNEKPTDEQPADDYISRDNGTISLSRVSAISDFVAVDLSAELLTQKTEGIETKTRIKRQASSSSSRKHSSTRSRIDAGRKTSREKIVRQNGIGRTGGRGEQSTAVNDGEGGSEDREQNRKQKFNNKAGQSMSLSTMTPVDLSTHSSHVDCPRAEDGLLQFACPTPDRNGVYQCIDDHALCDRRVHCPNGEDEHPTICMFHHMTMNYFQLIIDAFVARNKR